MAAWSKERSCPAAPLPLPLVQLAEQPAEFALLQDERSFAPVRGVGLRVGEPFGEHVDEPYAPPVGLCSPELELPAQLG